MTGSASVTIPALKAGQFGAKEVTIILSENFFAQEESSNSQIETTKHSGFKDNTSDYWYYITVTYTKKEGSEVIKNDYEGDDSEIKNIIDAYNKGVREDKVTLNDVQVLAHSRFSVFVDYMKTTSVYQIIEKSPKRDGNPVASFTVDSYNTIVSPKMSKYRVMDMLQVTATVMDMEMTAMPVVVLLLQTNSQLIF